MASWAINKDRVNIVVVAETLLGMKDPPHLENITKLAVGVSSILEEEGICEAAKSGDESIGRLGRLKVVDVILLEDGEGEGGLGFDKRCWEKLGFHELRNWRVGVLTSTEPKSGAVNAIGVDDLEFMTALVDERVGTWPARMAHLNVRLGRER
jgi:hypothetical protein